MIALLFTLEFSIKKIKKNLKHLKKKNIRAIFTYQCVQFDFCWCAFIQRVCEFCVSKIYIGAFSYFITKKKRKEKKKGEYFKCSKKRDKKIIWVLFTMLS